MADVNFRIPGKKDEGYLERSIQALEFKEKFEAEKAQGAVKAQTIKEMAQFLSTYVDGDHTPEEKYSLILKASEEQFEGLLELLTPQVEDEEQGEGGDQDPKEGSSSGK